MGDPNMPERLRSEHFSVRSSLYFNIEHGVRWLEDWLEPHYAQHADFLGLPQDEKRLVTIYFFHSDDHLAAYCPNWAMPCADVDRPVVFDNALVSQHELVHVYARQIGNPPSFFQEGLARMLGDHSFVPGQDVVYDVDIFSMMGTDYHSSNPPSYAGLASSTSASFSFFLVNQYGRVAYLDFYRSLPRSSNLEEVKRHFYSVFGDDLASVVERWRSQEQQTYGDSGFHLAQCAAPPLIEDDRADQEIELQWGARVSNETWSTVRSLKTTERSQLRLRTTAKQGAFALGIQGCREEVLKSGAEWYLAVNDASYYNQVSVDIGAAGGSVVSSQTASHELWTDLPGGQYWVWWRANESVSAPVWTSFEEDLLGDDDRVEVVAPDTKHITIIRDQHACAANECLTRFVLRFEASSRIRYFFQKRYSPGEAGNMVATATPRRIEFCRQRAGEWMECEVGYPEDGGLRSRGTIEVDVERGESLRVALWQRTMEPMAVNFDFLPRSHE
jgi:hypothetical protein